MKKTVFLLLIIMLNSCSLLVDKNKILTENTWILSKISSREEGFYPQYFKKSDKELVFKFLSNEILEITEANLEIPVFVNWHWDDSNKKKIIIEDGKFSGELWITTLDKNQFNFWQYEKNSLNSISYFFIRNDSEEWYEDDFVDGYRSAIKKSEAERLDKTLFEIIRTPDAATVQNFEVLIKFEDFNQESIKDFIEKFRAEFCTKKCNIFLYDSIEIIDLIDKRPLEGNDYIKVADHFVAMSTFDSPENIMWYPFQDFLYKEYGGKNWKKDEIK